MLNAKPPSGRLKASKGVIPKAPNTRHKTKLPKKSPEKAPKVYASDLPVPAKKKANAPLQGPPDLTATVPNMVPRQSGTLPGEQGKPSPAKPPSGSHGFGHDITKRLGHFRLSGHSGAHQLGKK